MQALDCFANVLCALLCQIRAPKLCIAQSEKLVVLLLFFVWGLVHGVRHVVLGTTS